MPGASLRAVAAAVTFLTRVPVPRLELDGADVARGAVFFPVVGAGVGAAVGGAGMLAYPALPALAAAGVALAVSVILTGAMHLDALADIADAGGSPRARALEIMRDPRIGSFGASALALDLLLKAAALGTLVEDGSVLAAAVAAGAVSRAVAPPLAVVLPYARARGGPGSVLTGAVPALAAAGGVAVGVAVAFAVLGVVGLVLAAAAAVTTAGLGLVYRRWLGGVTGDGLGAATEASETVALLVAVALT